MAGTWSTITNAPPDALSTTLLLTDGRVLAQGFGTNEWFILRPDANGSYANGTWTQVASSDEAPRFGMLETIREYGLECLAEQARDVEVRRAHATRGGTAAIRPGT